MLQGSGISRIVWGFSQWGPAGQWVQQGNISRSWRRFPSEETLL